jgi:type IV pilus assembly protein PilE
MSVRTEQGFSLIELMVAVAIAAIIAVVAIPSYLDYIKRAARAEARAALLEDSALMEQAFTVDNAYNGAGTTGPLGFVTQSPKSGVAKYTLTIKDDLTASKYTLLATPANTDKCGTFTLDNTGLRGLLNNSATVAECWGSA